MASSRPPEPGVMPGTRSFSVGFRGYDQHEVRTAIAGLEAELGAARARVEQLNAELATARSAAQRRVDLDEQTVASVLGEEAALLLATARQGAQQMRARAEESVATMLREAQDEASRLRADAEAHAARTRRDAEIAAANEIEAAKANGREMIAEAQAVRERILGDAAKRKRAARLQLEQLRAGRDRLVEAYEEVRRTLDAVTAELLDADESARIAASAVTDRAITPEMARDDTFGDDADAAALGRLRSLQRGAAVASPVVHAVPPVPAATESGPDAGGGEAATDAVVELPDAVVPTSRSLFVGELPGSSRPGVDEDDADDDAPYDDVGETAVEPVEASIDPSLDESVDESVDESADGSAVLDEQTLAAADATAVPTMSELVEPVVVEPVVVEPVVVESAVVESAVVESAVVESAVVESVVVESVVEPAVGEFIAEAADPHESSVVEPVVGEPATEVSVPEAAADGEAEDAASDIVDAELIEVAASATAIQSEPAVPDAEVVESVVVEAEVVEVEVVDADGTEAVADDTEVVAVDAEVVDEGDREVEAEVTLGDAEVQHPRIATVDEIDPALDPREVQPVIGAVPGGPAASAIERLVHGASVAPPGEVDALFARLREARAGAVAEAQRILAKSVSVIDLTAADAASVSGGARSGVSGTPALDATADAPMSAAASAAASDGSPEDSPDEADVRPTGTDDPALEHRIDAAERTEAEQLLADDRDPIAERDALVGPHALALARRLKRALADEQNEVLDRLRRAPKATDAEAVLQTVAAHAERYRAAAEDDLWAAALSGADAAGAQGEAGGQALERHRVLDVVLEEVESELSAPLRVRLIGSLSAAGGDADAASGTMRSIYREWKTHRLEAVAMDLALAAFGRGYAAALPEGTCVRWLIDPGSPPCPDADDNVLAGVVEFGTPFPTGHRHPPAHAGCRCHVFPAEE